MIVSAFLLLPTATAVMATPTPASALTAPHDYCRDTMKNCISPNGTTVHDIINMMNCVQEVFNSTIQPNMCSVQMVDSIAVACQNVFFEEYFEGFSPGSDNGLQFIQRSLSSRSPSRACSKAVALVIVKAKYINDYTDDAVIAAAEPTRSLDEYQWLWGAAPLSDPHLPAQFFDDGNHGNGWLPFVSVLPFLLIVLPGFAIVGLIVCVCRMRQRNIQRNGRPLNAGGIIQPSPSVYSLPYTAMGTTPPHVQHPAPAYANPSPNNPSQGLPTATLANY